MFYLSTPEQPRQAGMFYMVEIPSQNLTGNRFYKAKCLGCKGRLEHVRNVDSLWNSLEVVKQGH